MISDDDPKAQALIAKIHSDLASKASADVLRGDQDAIDALHNDGSVELRANLHYLRLEVERQLQEQKKQQGIRDAQVAHTVARGLTPAAKTYKKPGIGPTRRR